MITIIIIAIIIMVMIADFIFHQVSELSKIYMILMIYGQRC